MTGKLPPEKPRSEAIKTESSSGSYAEESSDLLYRTKVLLRRELEDLCTKMEQGTAMPPRDRLELVRCVAVVYDALGTTY